MGLGEAAEVEGEALEKKLRRVPLTGIGVLEEEEEDFLFEVEVLRSVRGLKGAGE